MKLDAPKLGLATAIAFAVVWAICSAFVMLLPDMMMQMSGHALHANMGDAHWTMQWTGFIVGLVVWSVLGGVLAWGIATVYNRLGG